MALLTERSRMFFVDAGGYKFTLDRISTANATISFYRCEFKNSCPARIHVQNGVVIKRLHKHTHASNPAAIQVTQIRNAIKQRAVDTQEMPNQVINSAIAGASQSVLGKLPKNATLAKSIRNVRKNVNQAPSDPQSTQELVIPNSFATYDDEKFLLIDTGTEDLERILVFGRQNYERWSHQVDKLYMDGTFKICPSIFSQVFEILGNRGSHVFPIFYCLLPNKRRATYDRLFQLIKDLRPQMNPNSVATDFEQAEFNAIREAWANCEIHGCFFHLNQSMVRKVSTSGLKAQYDSNSEFRLWCKMLTALAFVPIDQLNDVFSELTAELPEEFRDDLLQLLDWFEDYYLGRMQANGKRRRPMFPPEVWNLYNRVLNGDDRTNNFSEAAHKRVQKELCMDHPTIWRFIDGLRSIQKNRDKEYEEFIRGEAPNSKRLKYQKADDRIRLIVDEGFEQRTILEYLRGLAQNFDMDF